MKYTKEEIKYWFSYWFVFVLVVCLGLLALGLLYLTLDSIFKFGATFL